MIDIRADRKNKKTFISIDDATPRVRRGLTNGLRLIGRENVKHGRKLIRKPPKTGRIYTFGGSRHQASAPGEAPASRTGTLARSLKYRSSGWNFMTFGFEAEYGKFLEDGTKNMEKRPTLTRTAEDRSGENYNILAEQTGLEIFKK